MKKIFIKGILGNMGLRYKTILENLGHKVYGSDLGYSDLASDHHYDGYIIATPTTHHFEDLIMCSTGDPMPILCEKPITIISPEYHLNYLSKFEILTKNVTMVNQYRYLYSETSQGESYYNYFKTGKDGLAWDCVNVIGLSHDFPRLATNSPEWMCAINGKRLSLGDMDRAYINMIKDWLDNPKSNWDYAVEAHRKVLRWLAQ